MAPARHPARTRPTKIRVLLLEMTGIVADLVRRTVSEQADLEIVASVPALHELDVTAAAAEADLVITPYPSSAAGLSRFDDLLGARPGLRVLAIEDDGRRASMYALAPQATELGLLTPETLIEFIRSPWSRP
jgi:hypothetical protein